MSFTPIRAKQLFTCTTPVWNTSSAGVTTIDVIGNTYAEPAGQTRITMPAYLSQICLFGSWHVSAGTGSVELFNFTDSASRNTQTTTSTTEVNFVGSVSTNTGDVGDAITMRVKNSGAGNSTTIDSGGMSAADNASLTLLSTGSARPIPIVGNSSATGILHKQLKILPMKGTTTATFTATLNFLISAGATTVDGVNPALMRYRNTLKTITEADSGTVQTINLSDYFSIVNSSGTAGLSIIGSAVSGVSSFCNSADGYMLSTGNWETYT